MSKTVNKQEKLKQKEIIKNMDQLFSLIHIIEKISTKIYDTKKASEIYDFIIKEFKKIKDYTISIFLITPNKKDIKIIATSYKKDILKKMEQSTGIKFKDFVIPLDKPTYYSKVIKKGETICLNGDEILKSFLPKPHSDQISKIVGYYKKTIILTPLYKGKKIIGLISINSPFFTEYFIPTVKTLAKHISIAGELKSEHEAKKKIEKELSISKDKAHSIAEKTDELISVASFDKHPIFTYVNPAHKKILGYDPKELIGKSALDYIHPEDAKKANILLKRFINFKDRLSQFQDKSVEIKDIRYRDKKGGWHHLESTINFLQDEIIFVSRDITEKIKLNEQRLREKEEYFVQLVKQSTDLITVATADGTIKYMSPALKRIYGYRPEELINKNIFEFLHPEEMNKTLSFYQDVVKKPGVTPKIEYRIRHKNGSWIYSESTGSNLLHHPVVKGIIIHTRDISDRKVAEEKLQKSEEKYRSLIENVRDGIYQLDLNGRFTYVNEVIQKRSGYKEKWFLDKTYLDVIRPEDREIVKENFELTIQGKNVPSYELGYKGKFGKIIWVEVNSKAIYSDGKVIGLLGVSRDISERKKAEKSLQDNERRFRTIYNGVNDAIFIHDAKTGKVLDVNQRMCQVYGYTKEEAKRLSIKDITAKDQPFNNEIYKKTIALVKKGNLKMPVEWHAKDKYGNEFWSEVNAKILTLDNRELLVVTVRNIEERRKAEKEIKNKEEHLRNIIDSASEIIVSIDKNFKISSWNKSAERITNYKRKNVIGKSIFSVDIFDNPQEIVDYVKNFEKNKSEPFFESIIRLKNKEKRLVRFSSSIMKGITEKSEGFLLIGKDITKDAEIHGKIFQGNSYMIIDDKKDSAYNIFADLLMSNYSGLLITRNTGVEYKNLSNNFNIKTIILNHDKIKDFDNFSDLEKIITEINNFIKKEGPSLILFDRIDFLFTMFSFENVMKFVYMINNLIRNNISILFLRLNPSILDKKQLEILKEEIPLLPSQQIETEELDDRLYNILNFISEQNKQNILVTYSKIGKECDLSKVTTSKYLQQLMNKELIFIKKRGRLKKVNLTKKGMTLLNKRHII